MAGDVPDRELEGFLWRCMADPEGNEFDINVLPGA
jgi:hypothetical protein